MTKKFNGFTLAEVLITLGIIGVVAAMTMPTLINQTNGAQYKAAYKKALSAISQGITLNVALDDISFADAVQGTAGKSDEEGTIANILSKRMNVVKTSTKVGYGGALKATTELTDGESNTTLFFNDGSTFQFVGTAKNCSKDANLNTSGDDAVTVSVCRGFIDVNGLKGPNKEVVCDGTGTTHDTNCKVTSPTDIYPVVFYDQTILPNSVAASTVLYGK